MQKRFYNAIFIVGLFGIGVMAVNYIATDVMSKFIAYLAITIISAVMATKWDSPWIETSFIIGLWGLTSVSTLVAKGGLIEMGTYVMLTAFAVLGLYLMKKKHETD